MERISSKLNVLLRMGPQDRTAYMTMSGWMKMPEACDFIYDRCWRDLNSICGHVDEWSVAYNASAALKRYTHEIIIAALLCDLDDQDRTAERKTGSFGAEHLRERPRFHSRQCHMSILYPRISTSTTTAGLRMMNQM